MSTHLEMATQWAMRSLRRRAAGEHLLSISEIARLFGGEWMLSESDMKLLKRRLEEVDRRHRES